MNKKLFLILGILVVLIAGFAAARYHKVKKQASQRVEAQLQLDTLNAFDIEIIGNYDVLMCNGTDTASLTGYIDMDDFGQYRLHILSEYEPYVEPINVEADSTLSSENFGVAVISRKQSIGKTTIEFRKGEQSCVLTR